MDALLLDFAKDNMITISLVMGILKILAKESKWAGDDKILQLLTGIFSNKKI